MHRRIESAALLTCLACAVLLTLRHGPVPWALAALLFAYALHVHRQEV